MKTKTMKIKDIKVSGVIRTPFLPEGFIERVRTFKIVLAEVEKMTLEETVYNFQQDVHPEKELEIWEYITANYKDFTEANPNLTLKEKKGTFRVLLSLSMGAESLKTEKVLSKKQVQEIKNSYLNYD